MFSYTRLFLMVSRFSSNTRNIGVGKPDFREQLIGQKRWAIYT